MIIIICDETFPSARVCNTFKWRLEQCQKTTIYLNELENSRLVTSIHWVHFVFLFFLLPLCHRNYPQLFFIISGFNFNSNSFSHSLKKFRFAFAFYYRREMMSINAGAFVWWWVDVEFFSFFLVCDVLSIRSQNRLVLIENFYLDERI